MVKLELCQKVHFLIKVSGIKTNLYMVWVFCRKYNMLKVIKLNNHSEIYENETVNGSGDKQSFHLKYGKFESKHLSLLVNDIPMRSSILRRFNRR